MTIIIRNGVIFDDLDAVIQITRIWLHKLPVQWYMQQDGKFAALATAYANHGVFLYVPRGVKIKEPIHSFFGIKGII